MVFLRLEETAGLEVPEISHDPGYGHSSQKGTLGSESVEQTYKSLHKTYHHHHIVCRVLGLVPCSSPF